LGTFIYLKVFKFNIHVKNASLPEQIVFTKSDDDILNAGVIFKMPIKRRFFFTMFEFLGAILLFPVPD